MEQNRDKQHTSSSEVLFLLELLDCVLMVVSAAFGISSVVSLLLALNYIIIVALMVLLIVEQRAFDRNVFITYAIIISVSFLAMFAYGSVSFSYARKWLMFFCVMSLYFWAYSVQITKKMIDWLMACAIFLGVFFCFLYATGRTYPLENAGITFNLGNANFTGMWLLSILLIICFCIGYAEKVLQRVFLIILTAVLFYFLYLTGARSCLIAFVAFLGLRFFYHGKYKKWITFVMVLFPIVFAIIYMQLVDNTKVLDFFDFMTSEGKSLTSRSGVWKDGFELFLQYPILGNYNLSTKGTGISQYHNIYVDTLCTYGIIVQVAVIVFLNTILNRIGENIELSRTNYAAILGFYAILVSATFEAGLFSNSQGMYIMTGGLLLLARYRQEPLAEQDDILMGIYN